METFRKILEFLTKFFNPSNKVEDVRSDQTKSEEKTVEAPIKEKEVSPVVETPKPVNLYDALVEEAKKHIGVKETGPNKGPMIEVYQKAVDGKAKGEPYCLGFVQYCVNQVVKKNPLFQTEHVLTLWNNTPEKMKTQNPKPGCIVIWRFGKTISGHTGVVTGVTANYISTVEGNTSSGDPNVINREGDGVYARKRSKKGSASMRLLGYIDPFVV